MPAFMWPLIDLCNGENIELMWIVERQEERGTTGSFRACLHD